MQKLFQEEFSVSNAIMLGFLSAQAAFHVIAYPMTLLDSSFVLLFWIYSVILLLLCAAGILILLQKSYHTVISHHIKEICAQILSEPFVPLVAACSFCLFLLASLFFSFNTSDDSYYLPRVMEIVTQNRLGISEGFAWSGLKELAFPSSVDASSLEAWKAYWSYLFNLHPTLFIRNSFSFVIHIVSFCSLYQAFCSITSHKKPAVSSLVFLSVYFLLILLDNHKLVGTAPWILRYSAQGKSLLSSIIYPSLVFGCAKIVQCGKQHISWHKWMFLAIVFTAGVSSTIIGVYWPFLCCLTMGIPFLLIERRKDFFKLLPALFLACLPVIIYAGISYLTILSKSTNYFEFVTPSWRDAFTGGLNTNRLLLLFLSLLFTLLCGSKAAKMVVAGGCITLFITFGNPFFIGFVSKYLTTGSVYFRLFWMVPVYFLPAYVIAELFGGLKLKPRQLIATFISTGLALAFTIGILYLGPHDFCQALREKANLDFGVEQRTNPYGLPNKWYEIGNRLLEDLEEDERTRVIWLVGTDCHLRQYSERIEVIGACRREQWQYYDLLLEENASSPIILYNDFMQDEQQDFTNTDWAHEQLLASNVNYLCVSECSRFACRKSSPSGFELVEILDGIAVYRVIN